MPQDLPGFYYDPEKNRYFPIKGPIPGSASSHSRRAPSSSKPDQVINQHDTQRRKRIRSAELLQARELCGKVMNLNKWKCDFQSEYQKIQASHPVIWKYQGLDRVADSGLEQFHVDVQTPEGRHRTSVLLMGSIRGSLRHQFGSCIGKFRHRSSIMVMPQ